jgi:hypothetical protein
MRRLVLLVVALFLLSAAPASAGGPTSVLIVSPTEQRVGALYTSQSNYEKLTEALGPPQSDPNAPSLHGGPGTSAINITWLIHDVSVWRVDRVFMTADGGPWVETAQSYEGVSFDQPGSVYRPKDPAKLHEVLTEVLGPPAQTIGHPARAVTAPQPQAAAPVPAVQPATGLQWTSLIIGVIGGVVLMFFGRVVVSVVRRRNA